jgi:tRNA dimethylallyltransferase
MADQVISGIYDRGNLPIVVGGTGLYLRALLFGLANIPSVPAEVRDRLLAELDEEGEDALFERLQQLDPFAAGRISGGARNAQRVVRALEVAEHTGRPLSSYWEEQPTHERYDAVLIMPVFETSVLANRISERVARMIQQGLVEEVRNLVASGVDPDCRAMKSLGYRETMEHIRGGLSLEQAIAQIERGHRRYARRQRTWFKAMDNVYRLDAAIPELRAAATAILQRTDLVVVKASE